MLPDPTGQLPTVDVPHRRRVSASNPFPHGMRSRGMKVRALDQVEALPLDAKEFNELRRASAIDRFLLLVPACRLPRSTSEQVLDVRERGVRTACCQRSAPRTYRDRAAQVDVPSMTASPFYGESNSVPCPERDG